MKMKSIFKPRHKRLVNSIYPQNPYEGLKIDGVKRMLIYAYTQQRHFNKVLMYLTIKLKKYAVIGDYAYMILTLDAINVVLFEIIFRSK